VMQRLQPQYAEVILLPVSWIPASLAKGPIVNNLHPLAHNKTEWILFEQR
jgi:hypothetical protein